MVGYNNATGPDRTEVQGQQDPLDVTLGKVGVQIEGTLCPLKQVNELGRQFHVGRQSHSLACVFISSSGSRSILGEPNSAQIVLIMMSQWEKNYHRKVYV